MRSTRWTRTLLPLLSHGASPSLRAFGFGAAVAIVAWACQPVEDTQVPDPPPFHSGFLLSGAHQALDCDTCHIGSAVEQGLPPERETGWVTALGVGCLDCHRDTTAQLFPGGHKNGASCAEVGCHSASDFCWAQVWRACGDPGDTDPPAPATHDGQTALNFPLEGVHALGCAECHANAPDFSGELGGGDRCTDCHGRLDTDGIDGTHYPPDRTGGDDKERDCKACHAKNDSTGKLLVPATWADQTYFHVALSPHATVESWDVNPPVLRAETDWVGCASCHPSPGNYAAWSCDSAGCHTPDTLSLSHPGYLQNNTCAGCHPGAN